MSEPSPGTGVQPSRRAFKPMVGRILRLAGLAATGILCGAVAGAIVGGGGSRIAMRILAVVNPSTSGIVTENGNIAGQITAEGTADLVFFSIFVGAFGGLVYMVVRRWMPGSGLWKCLADGVFLFCLLGRAIISDENKDFTLFGPPSLGVSLFALLFPLYGLAVSPLVERFNRYIPPLFAHRVAGAVGYVVLAGLAALGLFFDVTAMNALL